MDSATEACGKPSSFVYLKAAFIAMEPVDCLISLARQVGGGSITTRVQTFILEDCINDNEDQLLKENNRICKQVTFLLSPGNSTAVDLVVSLQCSLNMLEGDTGFVLTVVLFGLQVYSYQSLYFLSKKFSQTDFALRLALVLVWLGLLFCMLELRSDCYNMNTYFAISSTKANSVFRVANSSKKLVMTNTKPFSKDFHTKVDGRGGLIGMLLVILTDGDLSTLANMRCNLKMNNLMEASSVRSSGQPMVECRHLPWESVSKSELLIYQPEIVLGADIIYDPLCIPHLIRVLSTLLNSVASEPKANQVGCYRFSQESEDAQHGLSTSEPPIAYIATVIRNQETFDCFLRVATENSLSVVDVTEMVKPLNLLPYMQSYDRSSVHLLRVLPICL
ncbi:hypothetical protein ZIOFF_045731 [Zingiber officinale]|uniref:Uncharacterized protein n=1 Tax=Zingiber officinale TaxID=94328 RepID=A0A8J5FXU5_ZINOF|nr:hypothetical protein ZIOFF_045731 [Zingiber officinale]